MTARIAALPLVLVSLLGGHAAADGERTPMLGLAVVGAETARTQEQDTAVAGVALDLAWWHGRFGLAAEGSARWRVDTDTTRAITAGASARFLVLDRMTPALLEPRDVEMGVELQAIVERTWWNASISNADPTAYGLGLAVRFRGSGDRDDSMLLAESRFFVRVMSSRWNQADAVARTTAPLGSDNRALTVLVGIGASFGAGTSAYLDRFRLHPGGFTLL